MKIPPTEKVCRTCEKVKDADSFYTRPNFPDGLDRHCRECRKVIGDAYGTYRNGHTRVFRKRNFGLWTLKAGRPRKEKRP